MLGVNEVHAKTCTRRTVRTNKTFSFVQRTAKMDHREGEITLHEASPHRVLVHCSLKVRVELLVQSLHSIQ